MSKKKDYEKIIHDELNVPYYLIFEDTKGENKFKFKTSENSSFDYYVDFDKKTVVARLTQDIEKIIDITSNADCALSWNCDLLKKHNDAVFNSLRSTYDTYYKTQYSFDKNIKVFVCKSKCCDEDEFSLEIGFEIAKTKALAEAHIYMNNAYNFVADVYDFIRDAADSKSFSHEELICNYIDKLSLYADSNKNITSLRCANCS